MGLHQLRSVPHALAWLAERGARALVTDSRRVNVGDAFLAWPGLAVDGRGFVSQALHSGAVACLIEQEGARDHALLEHPALACMADLKAHAGELAHAFWQCPSHVLDVLAVTGTNGKTSTAWWLAQALSALGRRCALVGTLGLGQPPDEMVFNGLTTPDPVTLHSALHRWVEQGFTACALEASSIGLNEHRLDGTRIAVALFTNFTQDHLDYHGDMAHYWAAKARLFAWPGLHSAVINLDDPQGLVLLETLPPSLDIWTYARHPRPARLQAHRVIDAALGGLSFEVFEQDGARASVRTTLIGDYNLSNLLAVIGGLRALGVSLSQAAQVCSTLTPVPGRMQRVPGPGNLRGPEVVVDYAHTPDALEKALQALRPWAQARQGRLWCVFGCGGNRDASKRSVMGLQAQRWADQVVVTSDNPRHEPPEHILRQIAAEMTPPVTLIEDRAQAIAHAIEQARANDVILLAGKGHETYQEIAGIQRPFSDWAQARAALEFKETIA